MLHMYTGCPCARTGQQRAEMAGTAVVPNAPHDLRGSLLENTLNTLRCLPERYSTYEAITDKA